MASTAAPSRGEVLSLFRSLLRTTAKFPYYNIREYIRRRTIDSFCANRLLAYPSSFIATFADYKSQLVVTQCQSLVYYLYVPKVKRIMEIKTAEGGC
ncbi:hypothetical protein AXF42_Ash013524 [Apostasia shenzhenica]|uniref:Complex 1 LYR protein domain-containing protein n=1 Tax=Apostasia shenzhenica TaxID=1088818 RepID=A0A2I0A4G1_9ASPA|nr:hypothetical protein AXF42_Ash013524 [Apostasia shenzhenica]